MFDELDAEVSRFLSSPSITAKGQGSKYVISPDSQSAWREQLQGKTQPNAMAQYSETQKKLQNTLLEKSLGRKSPDKYVVPVQKGMEKSQVMIKEKRNIARRWLPRICSHFDPTVLERIYSSIKRILHSNTISK